MFIMIFLGNSLCKSNYDTNVDGTFLIISPMEILEKNP